MFIHLPPKIVLGISSGPHTACALRMAAIVNAPSELTPVLEWRTGTRDPKLQFLASVAVWVMPTPQNKYSEE